MKKNVNIILGLLLCLPFSGFAQENKPKSESEIKKQFVSVRQLMLDQWKTNAPQEEKNKAAEQLGGILEEMAEFQKNTANDRLSFLLQAAGTYGLKNDVKLMEQKMDEALKKFEGLDAAAKIEAYQNAALLYMYIRAYDVVRVLKERGDALLEASRVRNSFVCRFMPSVPLGAGGWAQSDFIKNTKNIDSRFRPYPKDGDMLKDDVAAIRPPDEKDAADSLGRETFFSMVYDTNGWHIYVQSNEPDIDQIMLEDGRRGSTLEMFFAPGREGVPYYQWSINLPKNELIVYDWGTAHRFYRHLEQKVGSLEMETVVLPKGWGTHIFIPWEALYDRLPFINGNDDIWRFSIMRWGPVRMTWGGRVHETARWGYVKWEAPTPAQLMAIEKHLIKKAWWRYQATKSALSDYWQSSRGDAKFYSEALEPLFKRYDEYNDKIIDVDKWDAKVINNVFMKMVPQWMEINYEAAGLRTQYLKQNIFLESAKNKKVDS